MRLSQFEQNYTSVSVLCVFSAHHRIFFPLPYKHFAIGSVKSLFCYFWSKSHQGERQCLGLTPCGATLPNVVINCSVCMHIFAWLVCACVCMAGVTAWP